jgi:hypothetical protein
MLGLNFILTVPFLVCDACLSCLCQQKDYFKVFITSNLQHKSATIRIHLKVTSYRFTLTYPNLMFTKGVSWTCKIGELCLRL